MRLEGRARFNAWPFSYPLAGDGRRRYQEQTLSRSSRARVQAEAAFLKAQTRSLSRNRIISETDAVNQARDANTARLKEQRLNKEALDRAAVATAPGIPLP